MINAAYSTKLSVVGQHGNEGISLSYRDSVYLVAEFIPDLVIDL